MDKELTERNLEVFQLKQAYRTKEALLSQVLQQVEDNRKTIVDLEHLRDDLTHMIIHDLKNPLTGIASTIEMLTAGLICPISDEQKKYFELVQGSVRAMTSLIMNILDVRKMEENKMELQKSVFSAAELVNNVAWMKLMAEREEKQLNFNFDEMVSVNADLNLISRVVENLLSNAIKHTDRGQKISLNIKKDGGNILVEVVDTGEGIPPEYLGRVFDRFFKVEKQTHKTRIDTGLGLTFCKLAVEAHGGSIGVDSQVGKGSRFYFYLPAG